MEDCHRQCFFSGGISSEDCSFTGDLDGGDCGLTGAVPGEIVTYLPEMDKYEGPALVVPAVEEQVLPTAEKYLQKDITVEAIPLYEVSNDSGGKTVIIGG